MSTSTTNRKGSSQDVALIEYLSALLDDEVGDFERKRVLDELERDDFLAQKLANYALISETLHSEESACFAGPDFLQGVRRQLESEPAYSTQTLYANTSDSSDSSGSSLERKPATQKQNTGSSGIFGRWLRPVGGFAMAASVAAVAVIGFQYYWGQSGLSNSSLLTSLSINNAENKAENNVENSAAQIASNTPNQAELTQKQLDKAVLASAESLPSIQKNILRQEETVVNSATASPQGNVLSDPFYRQADMKTRALLKRYVDSHIKYASTNAFVPSVRVIAYSDY